MAQIPALSKGPGFVPMKGEMPDLPTTKKGHSHEHLLRPHRVPERFREGARRGDPCRLRARMAFLRALPQASAARTAVRRNAQYGPCLVALARSSDLHIPIATGSADPVASPRFRRGFTAARPMRIEGVGRASKFPSNHFAMHPHFQRHATASAEPGSHSRRSVQLIRGIRSPSD